MKRIFFVEDDASLRSGLTFGTIGGIVALLVFTSLAAPFAPAKRVCALPMAGSINEL